LKRYTVYIILGSILLLLFGIYKFFNYEFIELEQEYLIEKNYETNKEIFSTTISDFEIFPNVSIIFGEGGYVELRSSGYEYLKLDSNVQNMMVEKDEIAFISVVDSNKTLYYKNKYYDVEIKNIEIEEPLIKVNLVYDTIITIDKFWDINYSGNLKTDLCLEILKTLDLDLEIIRELKNQLRKRNCFGCTINEDVIILHYSSQNDFVINAYSYCIFKNEKFIDSNLNSWYNYQQLDSNIYWFFYDIQIIDLLNPTFYTRDI
jgi:hypothetical protein